MKDERKKELVDYLKQLKRLVGTAQVLIYKTNSIKQMIMVLKGTSF